MLFITLKILIVLTFLSFNIAQAELFKVTGGSDGGLKKLSPNIRLVGTVRLVSGELGSKDEQTTKSRSMSGFGADLIIGYNLGPVIFGGGAEYIEWFQGTNKDNTNDTDLSGRNTDFFGSLGLGIGKLLLNGKYYFQSTLDIKNKNSLGETLKYGDAYNSYAIQAMYRAWKKSFLTLEFRNINYKEQKTNGSTSTLSEDARLFQTSYGVGWGMFF